MSQDDDDDKIEIGKFIINEFFSPQKTDEINRKLQKSKEEVNKIEAEIIKRITGKIHLDANNKTETKKASKGSLYDLFDSYFFNMHLLICYIDKKDDIGIVDTLVNLIYKRYINESLNYLPQIWFYFNLS